MTALVLEVVLPDMLASASVDRKDVVGDREIEDPVHEQRRGFDRRAADTALWADTRDAVHPFDLEQVHRGLVDLVEIAESPPGIVAIVGWPDVCRAFEQGQSFWIESLAAGEHRQQRQYVSGPHLSVTR